MRRKNKQKTEPYTQNSGRAVTRFLHALHTIEHAAAGGYRFTGNDDGTTTHAHTNSNFQTPRGLCGSVAGGGGERSIGTIIHPFTPFSKPFGVFRRVGSFAVGCAFALPTAYHTLRVCDTKSIWRIRARRLPSSRDPQHTNVRKVNGRFKEAAESESKKKSTPPPSPPPSSLG